MDSDINAEVLHGSAPDQSDALPPGADVGENQGFLRLAPEKIRFDQRTSYVGCLIFLPLITAGAIALLIAFWSITWVIALTGFSWMFLVALAIYFAHFWPAIAYRNTSWRLNEIGMEIHRGVLWKHRIAIPVSRVQHVDVSQGPVQRMFMLSTIAIHTAGTQNATVELEGLNHSVAMEVRDALIKDDTLAEHVTSEQTFGRAADSELRQNEE